MSTIILTWNPTISKFKTDDFMRCFQILKDGEAAEISWHVGKITKFLEGDRFFLLNQSQSGNGIVMAGYLCSDSYEDDEAGDHQVRYKINIDPLVMVNTNQGEGFSVARLKKVMPEVDWENVTNGTIIDEKKAAKLEDLWLRFLYDNRKVLEGSTRFATSWNFDIEDFESIPPVLQDLYKKTRGCKCEKCGRSEAEVTELAYHLVIDASNDDKTPFEKSLHCYCSECWFE